jgi:hypothetical protein
VNAEVADCASGPRDAECAARDQGGWRCAAGGADFVCHVHRDLPRVVKR